MHHNEVEEFYPPFNLRYHFHSSVRFSTSLSCYPLPVIVYRSRFFAIHREGGSFETAKERIFFTAPLKVQWFYVIVTQLPAFHRILLLYFSEHWTELKRHNRAVCSQREEENICTTKKIYIKKYDEQEQGTIVPRSAVNYVSPLLLARALQHTHSNNLISPSTMFSKEFSSSLRSESVGKGTHSECTYSERANEREKNCSLDIFFPSLDVFSLLNSH